MQNTIGFIERSEEINLEKCPECGYSMASKGYQNICKNCGVVIGEDFIQSSYKMFDSDDLQFSQGKQYVYIGKTLETVGNLGSYIGYYNKNKDVKDINGQQISQKMQLLFSRLKNKYSKFSKIKNQETDYRIMNILADVVKYMNLNQGTRKDAAYYFWKIKSMNSDIRNNISLIAFCIFFAVRNQNQNAPVTIKEISDVFQMLGHRVIPRLIIRDGLLYKKMLNPPKPHKSEDYVSRLIDSIINYPLIRSRMEKKSSEWKLDDYRTRLYNQTLEILKDINIGKRGGRNPYIFSGAAVYCADKILAKLNNTKSILTQRIASDAMHIAEYSIRDHYVSVFKNYTSNYFSN
jgi:transcription initiation factor TFIIIB Brf1 subunit/transcription initiation factor TFIIB